ncbi:MAG: hypothetical protein JNK19_08585 [Tabrizicola sp.]|nr:hypothetical protein [Tabrizicola sp.]
MTQEKPKRWGRAIYTVQEGEGQPREIALMGRDRWALEMLLQAGPRGITAIEMNGPRLHAYIFDLRHEHGLSIVREDEPHGGDFLKSKVARKTAQAVAA